MGWHPKLENGELLKAAEAERFDVFVSCDQNIRYQQNLTGRVISVVVLGSNIWPAVADHATTITSAVDRARPGGFQFIEIARRPWRKSRLEG